jgi:hypothetical protein
MKITNLLPALLLAGASALAGCGGGAVYTSDGYVSGAIVYSAPPAPRVVVTPAPRPGFVYVQGRWVHNNNRWVWRDGYWVRERVGYYYKPGRWQRRNGGGYVWVEGRWSTRDNRRGRVHYR